MGQVTLMLFLWFGPYYHLPTCSLSNHAYGSVPNRAVWSCPGVVRSHKGLAWWIKLWGNREVCCISSTYSQNAKPQAPYWQLHYLLELLAMGMLRAIHALHMLFETLSRMTLYGLQNGGNSGMVLIMCLTLSMYLSWWKLGTKSFLLWNGKRYFLKNVTVILFHAMTRGCDAPLNTININCNTRTSYSKPKYTLILESYGEFEWRGWFSVNNT